MNFAIDNAPVRGCTISEPLPGLPASVFSLAAGTSISAESYDYPKLFLLYAGDAEVFTNTGDSANLHTEQGYLLQRNVPTGIRTKDGCVYLEIEFLKESTMNEVLQAGEVFSLKDLIPYQDGRIVNMDLMDNDHTKFVLMSFDAGTGLSEHAAPGDALVLALDGKAVIGYEGKDYPISAGETFKFDKNGRHSVTADGKFKMALLLELV